MENSVLWYAVLFFLPFICALVATPLVSKLAKKHNILDKPGFHKTHLEARPLLGGISIFISFSAIMYVFLPLEEHLLALGVSTAILVAVGLVDDLCNLSPLIKLGGQILAASVMVLWTRWQFLFMAEYFERFMIPEAVVLVLVIGWVVLMVNAFNLIDGMDGLAAGTAAIIFMAMAVISVVEGGRSSVLAVQLIGAGACLGFLVFNFNPAKIFMGDAGSMLLGFIIATAHLHAIKYPFNAQLVLGSMFIMAYPALDVTYAFYRRYCNRCPIFSGDRGHIHHVIKGLGYTVRQTVLIIYGANIVFASIGVALFLLDVPARYLFAIGVLTAVFVTLLFNFLLKISRANGVR